MIQIDKETGGNITFPTHFTGGDNNVLETASCILIMDDGTEFISDTIIDYNTMKYWHRYMTITLSVEDLSELTVGKGGYSIVGDDKTIGEGVFNLYLSSDKVSEVETINYDWNE